MMAYSLFFENVSVTDTSCVRMPAKHDSSVLAED